jgi:hypothetical protein
LERVQRGKMPENAKPLKGIAPGVLEIISDFRCDTFRAVYPGPRILRPELSATGSNRSSHDLAAQDQLRDPEGLGSTLTIPSILERWSRTGWP